MQRISSHQQGVRTTLHLTLVALASACSGRATDSAEPFASISGAVTAAPTEALSGLAQTPPMGFNDWNAFGCNVSEALIRETADFFVSSGLKDAGYRYVNIDDCWALRERGSDGRLVPDPVKFPSGIAGVADYVHGLGLKLGIYGDAGTLTCGGYPGSLGREDIDAQTWAEWGVDYLKYDNCYNESDGSRADFVNRYTAMREAIDRTLRPIVYSICEWGQSQPWEWATDVGHLWRTTGDITDDWASVRSIIAFNAPLAPYAGPGHWNDPDMLEIGNGGMTGTEYRSHMSLWSMMAAPLLIGTDLREATPETLAILSNPGIVAIDQDALGAQARVVSDAAGQMVLAKPLANGDTAIALYNSTDAPATIAVSASQAGLSAAPGYRLDDVWAGTATQARSTIAAGVPAHGTVVYRTSRSEHPSRLPPAVSLGAGLDTFVVGAAEPPRLTTSAINHGATVASALGITVSAPEGWAVIASTPSTSNALDTDASLATTWALDLPSDVAAGKYPLTVTASYTWGQHSEPYSVTTLLEAAVVIPPPDGSTPLSALVPLNASSGWGPIERDTSNGEQAQGDGRRISIGGQVYAQGLGVHAPSELTFFLGGRCSTLTTDVGIDDEVLANGSASFRIYADDRLVADSGEVTFEDAARTLLADLTGATSLRLVTDAGGSTNSDHTDWAAPQLVCGVSAVPSNAPVPPGSPEPGK